MGRPRAARRARARRGVWRREALAAARRSRRSSTRSPATACSAVLVGARRMRPAATEVVLGADGVAAPPLNLVGRTDLPTLAGVLAHCRALVTNDSGAMHSAAAARRPRDRDVRPDQTSARPRPIGGDRTSVLTHPVWCRPCMLRECPLDSSLHDAASASTRCSTAARGARCDRQPAVFLDRDGTIIEEVGYLDRARRIALYPWTVDAIRALNRAGLAGRRGHEPVGRRARLLHRSGRRRGASPHRARCSRPAARASTRITIVRTIRTARCAAYASPCDCRKPGRGLVDRAVARARRRSGALVRRRRHVARRRRWRARSARAAILVRTGYGADEETRPPPDVSADAVVDNLAAPRAGFSMNRLNPNRHPQSEI